MKRKLASVQRISELLPIEGADRIEVARLQGLCWNVVVAKGLHRVGDLVVYCEVDSLLPADRFPEMEKFKYRVKTIRLKGIYSQGYIIPMVEAVQKSSFFDNNSAYLAELGSDFTEYLGVVKWEPPESCSAGDTAGPFPSHLISETDEMRVQSVPAVVEELRGLPYWITQKDDGMSYTAVNDDNTIKVCSRTLSKKDGDNAFWNVTRKYDIEKILRDNPRVGIQGELCGPGIQSNKLGLKSHELHVFNLVDVSDNRRRVGYDEMSDFCAKYGLTPVTLIESGNDFQHSVESLLTLAEGKYPLSNREREGIVIRGDGYSKVLGGPMSFKCISNRFLVRNDE